VVSVRFRTVFSIVIAAILVAVAPKSWAQTPPQDPQVAAIHDAFAGGRFGEMYQQATALSQERPDDAWVRYLAALAAVRTARNGEAMQQIDAGLAKHPDSADLLGLRASIRLATGDEPAARVDAQRALELAPEAMNAGATLDEIELGDRARERRTGEPAGLQWGSAAWFVDRVIEHIAEERGPSEIAPAFDPEMLISIPGPPLSSSEMTLIVRTALDEARYARFHNDQRFLGWIVSPETRQKGGRTWVDVQVPFETTFTDVQRRAIEVALADPTTRGVIAPEVLSLVEGVPPEERPALLARMVGTHQRAVLHVAVETRKVGDDAWKITDLQVNGVSMKAQLVHYAEVVERVDPSKRKRSGDGADDGIGRLPILLLVGGVIGFLIRRGRRR